MTVAKAKVPPGTPLPQFNTILWIHVTHQGQPHRLGPIQCARTFTYDDLKWRLANRFGLQGERFSVIWFDDDNNEADINDDTALFDALDYFTPAAISASWTPASLPSSPAESEGSSSSEGSSPSDGARTVISADQSTSNQPNGSTSPRASIELCIHVKLFSKISLSDFAPSSAGSVSGARGLWDSESEFASQAGYDDGFEWRQLDAGGRENRYHPSLPGFNGSRRLDSVASYSVDQMDEDDQEGTEYAFSLPAGGDPPASFTSGRGSLQKRRAQSQSGYLPLPAQPLVTHHDTFCIVCGMKPIRGVRYICVMCSNIPSFCGACEDAGRSIQYAPHLATHALLRLVEPMASGSRALNAHLQGTSHEFESRSQDGSIATTLIKAGETLSSTSKETAGESHWPSSGSVSYSYTVLCSFCSERIVEGPRYLCANCPLDLPTPTRHPQHDAAPHSDDGQDGNKIPPQPSTMILTPHEGFNLCSACEKYSLSIHDSNHFFLRIPGSAWLAGRADGERGITPLHLNPNLTIEHRTQGLLPMLYQHDEDEAWLKTQRRIADEENWARRTVAGSSSDATAANGQSSRGGTSEDVAVHVCNAVMPKALYDEIELARLRIEQEQRRAVDEVIFARDEVAQELSALVLSPPTTGSMETSYPPRPSVQPGDGDWHAPTNHGRAHMHLMDYVNSIRHASLMCDLCLSPIQGCWLRCTNCKHSFDICSLCEPQAMSRHESSHTFVIFKRRVDLDLFKSLVDHVDSDNPRFGPGRAMIPFLLV